MDVIDKINLSCRLALSTVLSIGGLIFPESIFEYYTVYNIKKINKLLNINNGSQQSGSIIVHNEVQSEGQGSCVMAEESSGSCCEHDYDKVSTTESNQSKSDEDPVSSE
jgi:hypothetical protein